MLKTVYFDLGNVLLFFDHQKMIAQVAALSGLSLSQVNDFFFIKKGLDACETGKMSSDQMYRTLQSQSPHAFSFDALMHAASDIFIPNEEALLLLKPLKQQGIRLILISNVCECHFAKASLLFPIAKIFDARVLSFQVGYTKPAPQIFQKAIEEAEAPLDACFYTDDIPSYIEGARKLGLPGEVFTSAAALKLQLMERGCDFL